jgi:hypothetical protein
MPSLLGQIKPWYSLSLLGPTGIAISNLTTVAEQVLGSDQTRAGVIFHNPGSTYPKRVLPAGTTAADLAAAIAALVGGSGGILIEPQSELILLQDETDQYNVNCAWVGVTDNNADAALSIFNFTPSGQPIRPPTMRYSQQIPVTSPLATSISGIGTGSQALLGFDANRTGVKFHNPGTITDAVCPANLGALIGAGSMIVLPGDTKTIMGNDQIKVTCGWNVAAASPGGQLTALSFYG